MADLINDGGPAFPGFQHTEGHGRHKLNAAAEWEVHASGMTLRDYFSSNAPSDAVQEILFRHLSLDAQEAITGLKRPVDEGSIVHAERIAFQLADFDFKCAVDAAIRYRLADAMLKARQQ